MENAEKEPTRIRIGERWEVRHFQLSWRVYELREGADGSGADGWIGREAYFRRPWDAAGYILDREARSLGEVDAGGFREGCEAAARRLAAAVRAVA